MFKKSVAALCALLLFFSLNPVSVYAMEQVDTPDYKVAFYAFDCQIVYYETPTELTNALVNDEVDALVNSYNPHSRG